MKKGEKTTGVVFHAGFPNAAEDRPASGVSLDKLVIRHPASTYMWRLGNEGISELGWQPESLVVVDRALVPKQGSLLVAVVDEEFAVRRLHQGKLYMPSGQQEPSQEVAVWGVITHVLQDYV